MPIAICWIGSERGLAIDPYVAFANLPIVADFEIHKSRRYSAFVLILRNKFAEFMSNWSFVLGLLLVRFSFRAGTQARQE